MVYKNNGILIPSLDVLLETKNPIHLPRYEQAFKQLSLLFLNASNHFVNLVYGTPSNIVYPRKKVTIFGVHGWFPHKWVQRLVGVPQGTSKKLATEMFNVCGGIPIFLTGNGKIMERVELHFNQVKGYRQILEDSTDVYFVAHSQGCPVSAILIDKLIGSGLLNPLRQNIGFLALAGVFQGPIPLLGRNLYVQYVETDAARELFELNDPSSTISLALFQSLYNILFANVRIVAVGSWFDQVVPIYSSNILSLKHPGVLRILNAHSKIYGSDFLLHLVNISLKLIFLGDDFGHLLLTYLTPYLSGKLFDGLNAHSNMYENQQIYDTARKWFENRSKQFVEKPNDFIGEIFKISNQMNEVDHSSHIAWIIHELLVKKNFYNMVGLCDDYKKTVSLYKQWQPIVPNQVELKQRLSPLKYGPP